MSRYADMAKVVPGAWETIKARREEINRRDPKAKAAWERRMARNAERSVKATAKMYAREHGSGNVNGATFAAFLRACGFGLKVTLVPFQKKRVAT